MSKSFKAYKTIGEVVKIINLNNKTKTSILAHTLRFWEKEFKQIKPKIFNGNRRYYDEKDIELLKKVHFLLKEQGMTIKGVKKLLNYNDPLKLDEIKNHSISTENLKLKLSKISKIIKDLKKI